MGLGDLDLPLKIKITGQDGIAPCFAAVTGRILLSTMCTSSKSVSEMIRSRYPACGVKQT